jgi:hypothetical protein
MEVNKKNYLEKVFYKLEKTPILNKEERESGRIRSVIIVETKLQKKFAPIVVLE